MLFRKGPRRRLKGHGFATILNDKYEYNEMHDSRVHYKRCKYESKDNIVI